MVLRSSKGVFLKSKLGKEKQMLKSIKNKTKASYYTFGATVTLGIMGISPAMAAPGQGQNNTADFGYVAQQITGSVSTVPGMISGVAYLVGSLLGVLGVMKIKDHVENPGNTPLKDGAIRLVAGGALFALPIIFESMLGSVDDDQAHLATQQTLQAVGFCVEGASVGGSC